MTIWSFKNRLKQERIFLFFYGTLLLLIGLFYAGPNFIAHLTDGVAANAYGGGVEYMLNGDQHEQFYRYSLFYENILRGRFPYYTGYQFASQYFTEGLVFFPFSAIVGIFTFLFGPIFSFNLMLLASFPAVGIAGYMMVRTFTEDRASGALAGLFLALVPFRTSFLFGEMVYGIDAIFLPLLIYFFQAIKVKPSAGRFLWLGILLFFMMTANFQMAYWVFFIMWPFFFYCIYAAIERHGMKHVMRLAVWAIPGGIFALMYGVFLIGVMKAGALNSGQNFAEALFYTPEFFRIFQRFNGNEKNVYLGVLAPLVILWIFAPVFFVTSSRSRDTSIGMVVALFFISICLVFGPRLDSAINIHGYRWMFDHIPGFNGTRTPGRIMTVVVVLFAILLGASVAWFLRLLEARNYDHVGKFVIFILMMVIIWDFKYTNPKINIFMKENKAYASIANRQNKVLAIPFQFNSGHHFNSTFLPLALKYDLKLFSGHSSFYPKGMDEDVAYLYSINDGLITKEQWKWLVDHGYEYLVAHNTEYEPRVNSVVISILDASAYLTRMIDDEGVIVYHINSSMKDEQELFDINRWADKLRNDIKIGALLVDKPVYAFGWYGVEKYDGEIPFQWMNGTVASIVLPQAREASRRVSFQYQCPNLDQLSVTLSGGDFSEVRDIDVGNNWREMAFSIKAETGAAVLFLNAPKIYHFPPDKRRFGCRLRNIDGI